jgi:hypothetical protein
LIFYDLLFGNHEDVKLAHKASSQLPAEGEERFIENILIFKSFFLAWDNPPKNL